jgi:hypothetical protein
MKNVLTIFIVIAVAVMGCKNPAEKQAIVVPPPPPVEAPKPAQTVVEAPKVCVLDEGSIKGVKVGDPMEKVKETYPVKITEKDGEGSFEVYVMSKDNVNEVFVYPIKKGGKEVVHMVEYRHGECTTKEGIKVGSTVADLRKAYPKLTANGSEIEGRTYAKGGGYEFFLDSPNFSYELDQSKLKGDVKVKAIVLK